MTLLRNIRFYVLLVSFTISFLLFFLYPDSYQRALINGICAAVFLYLTLLVGPLARIFVSLPFRGLILKARRALGVSSFYFALLHFLSTIDYQGGVFAVLSLVSQSPPILAGFVSLIFLTLMAITAFDSVIKKMTFPKWKFLHRFVYLVEILVFFHIIMLGSHFTNPKGISFTLLIIAMIFLVVLQVVAFIKTKNIQGA